MNPYKSMSYAFLQCLYDVPLQKGLQKALQRTR
jgi:hypothetical protein